MCVPPTTNFSVRVRARARVCVSVFASGQHCYRVTLSHVLIKTYTIRMHTRTHYIYQKLDNTHFIVLSGNE